MMSAKHSPENCPLNNEKAKKMYEEFMGNIDDLAKKYGVKILGSWTSMNEHLMVMVYEGSYQALDKLTMEPAIIKMVAIQDTCEIKTVTTMEESMKVLKMLK